MAKAQPILVLFLCSLLFGLGLAQEKKGGQTPEPTQPRTSPAPQRPAPPVQQPIFLTGKVIYGDGSPADLAASVELWCDGRVRHQVHTLNGRFSLQLGGSTQHVSTFDSSVSNENDTGNRIGSERLTGFSGPRTTGLSSRSSPGNRTSPHMDLSGCELRAEQTGFQSDEIALTFRRRLDNPDVGTLILYRAGSIAGTTSSVTTMAAPKKARKGFKKAEKEVNKKKANYRKAATELEKATNLYPEFSEAWNLLGQVRLQLKDESGAQEAFELAAASDPRYLGPRVAMMELESQREDWDQVSQRSTKVLELHPYHMQAHFYRGVANLNLRHMEQAEESLSKVRASHKADDFPYAGYLLGLMLADKGEFDAAAKELKHFLGLRPLAPEGARVRGFLSKWEKNGLIQGAKKN